MTGANQTHQQRFTQRLDAQRRLKAVLNVALDERHTTPMVIINTGDGPATNWAIREREVLLEVVNTIRAEHDLPAAAIVDIIWADNCCVGYVDWFEKFTWYCAGVALAPGYRPHY